MAPRRSSPRSATSRCCSPRPARSAPTPRRTCTSTPAGCCRARCRCGTRTSASARSPTRTSATCGRWGRTTGSPTSSACPIWIAQRLWLGSILFLAGVGVWFLLRTLRFGHDADRGRASFAYALTPYTLTLAARLSVILLPFAGLPWLIAFTIRAIRRGGWRDPALFALVVLTVGGVNATALVFAGVAPLLWFPFAVWGTKEATFRRAAGAFVRIGVLTLVTSLWWIAGLSVQGGYGIEILQLHRDGDGRRRRVGRAGGAARPRLLVLLRRRPPRPVDRAERRLHAAALAHRGHVPAADPRAARRGHHPVEAPRRTSSTLVVAGMFIAVGAHPWDDPPLTGQCVKALLLQRQGPRAAQHAARRAARRARARRVPRRSGSRRSARTRAAVRARPSASALAGARRSSRLPPLFTGGMVAANLERPRTSRSTGSTRRRPSTRSHTTRACSRCPAPTSRRTGGATPSTRSRPGSWTVRTWPASSSPTARRRRPTCSTRSTAACRRTCSTRRRSRRSRGCSASATSSPATTCSTSATASPARTRSMPLLDACAGPRHPDRLRAARRQRSRRRPRRMQDEAALRDDTRQPVPAGRRRIPVDGQQPIVRTATRRAAGRSSPATAKGSSGSRRPGCSTATSSCSTPARYAEPAAAARDAARPRRVARRHRHEPPARAALEHAARQRRLHRAGRRDSRCATDLTDNRLPVFPDAGDDAYTVAEYPGGVSRASDRATATRSRTRPRSAPANAVDGDLAHRVAHRRVVRRARRRARARLRRNRSTPTTSRCTRCSTASATARSPSSTCASTARTRSRSTSTTRRGRPPGQVLTFPQRTFSKLELIIRGDDSGRESEPRRPVRFTGLSEVGFSRGRRRRRPRRRVIRLPTDLLAAAGAASDDHPLTFVVRARSASTPPRPCARTRSSRSLARGRCRPRARSTLAGDAARLDTHADETITTLCSASSARRRRRRRRLPGDLLARATSAIDGDPTTAWTPAFDSPPTATTRSTLNAGRPVTFDHLDLQVVADGRHSVPTHLASRPTAAGGQRRRSPPIADARARKAPTPSPRAHRPARTRSPARHSGSSFDGVRQVTTTDWFSNAPVQMPIGIAELGVPALAAAVPTGSFDTGCRTDLLRSTTRPSASTSRARSPTPRPASRCTVSLCGLSADGVFLDSGDHVLRAAKGLDTGIDLDSLVLQSSRRRRRRRRRSRRSIRRRPPVRPSRSTGKAARAST